MSFLGKLLPILLPILFAIPVCLAQQGRNEVIAEVNGARVTLADLSQVKDPRTSAEILASAYEHYYSQRKALDIIIKQRLLADEAKRQNVTVDQLIAKVSQQVVAPTEQEMQTIYEFSGSTEPFEAMRDKIITQLRQVREQKAQSDFMEKLRAKASITVLLSPPVVEVALGDAPVRGPKNAAVALIEFADYECPYCQRTHSALKQLQKEFGDQVAIAYKDFPLPNHPDARKAAEASRCAREQGKYWEYHDLLYETKKYRAEDLKQHARDLHLNASQFDDCLASGRHTAAINSDFDQGRKLGISGTPSFFMNGRFLSGAVSYELLREIVRQLLASASAGGDAPKPGTSTKATSPTKRSSRIAQ